MYISSFFVLSLLSFSFSFALYLYVLNRFGWNFVMDKWNPLKTQYRHIFFRQATDCIFKIITYNDNYYYDLTCWYFFERKNWHSPIMLIYIATVAVRREQKHIFTISKMNQDIFYEQSNLLSFCCFDRCRNYFEEVIAAGNNAACELFVPSARP